LFFNQRKIPNINLKTQYYTVPKIESTPIVDGHRLYYNYIKPHESLDGKTPSEMAGITIEGDNKWLTLMKTSLWYQKKKAKSN